MGKKRTFITANEVNDLLRDDVAISLVEKVSGTTYQKKEKAIINIDTISSKYSEGEKVNLQSLKEKRLLPDKIIHYKILSRGKIDKALTIEANEFSIEAIKMILLTGGTVIEIVQ